MPASKTAKHKETNKHRFLTFSERLAQVSVNAVHRIRRVENSDDEDSNFHTCLLKWRDQDRSLYFQEFYAEIKEQSRNFKMIVHYKDHIVTALLKHLDIPDSLAIQALCELLVSLCIDVRSDFFPYFGDLFGILTKLLHTKDVERMEWIFSALSLMFKYLWKYMVSDIENVLKMYQNLLCGEHPDHIESFAAESVTFLIRKACGREGFFVMFFQLYKDSSTEKGIGELLFHLLKGVNKTLYSRTEVLLPKLLQCINDPDFDSTTVFQGLNYALSRLAKNVQRANSGMVWDALTCYFEKATASSGTLIYAIELAVTWCSVGHGVLILDEEKICSIVEALNKNYSGTHSRYIFDLCVTLISAKLDYFAQLRKDRIVTSIIRSKGHPVDLVVTDFWTKILKFVDSNNTIRRLMLNFCQVELQTHPTSIVQLLVDFVLENSALPSDAKDVLSYQPFNIDYALISRDKRTTKIQDSLKEIILCLDSKPDLIWCVLVLIGHINPVPVRVFDVLDELLQSLAARTLNNEWGKDQAFAIGRMLLQTAYFLHKKAVSKTKADFLKLCKLLFAFLFKEGLDELHSNPNLLFILDMLCQLDDQSVKKLRSLENIHQNFIENLSSPNPIIRKFSLRILVELCPSDTLFKQCLAVEETPATLQTYRDKALHLGKIQYSPDTSSESQEASLRYLLSNYYVNLSAYWSHVNEKISSFLPSDSKSAIWGFFFERLEAASLRIQVMSLNSGIEISAVEDGLEGTFLKHGVNLTVTNEANVKPDFYNHRYLIWTLLQSIPHIEILQKNNRHLVSLFLKFLEEECYIADAASSASQNLLGHNAEGVRVKSPISKKLCTKMLVTMLKVLARLNNPKGCYMSGKLKNIYEDLLVHGNSSVQKCALKCLLKFKDKPLPEFGELLLSLLDNDKIRETILQFKLDEVEKDKRKSLLPFLFKVMYGKIISRSSMASQSWKTRSTLLRFLSSLDKCEIDEFVLLVVDPVKHYVNESMVAMPLDENFDLNLNLRKVVPLSKQNGMLNTLTELIEKHPNILSERMFHYLLKLLLALHLSYYKMIGMIESLESQTVSESTVNYLRTLAKQVHNAINSLVSVWPDSLTFTSTEIKDLFYVLVNPHAYKMKNECISQPTALLKLCDEFSKTPKFIPLLGNRLTNGSCLINEVTKVLVSAKTSPAVSAFILQIIVRLLKDDEDKEMDVESDLVIQTLSSIESDIVDKDTTPCTIGLALMVNQVGDILRYFVSKLREKTGSGLIQSHLKILIALGHHVQDVDLSNELVELLLGHISNMARSGREIGASAEGKLILPALESLNVLPINPDFVMPISKLYSRIKSRECRICLGKVFEKTFIKAIGPSDPTLTKVASIVSDLNSWDKRFIEELDYDSRLAGFQELIDILESEGTEILFQNDCLGLIPLLHNCIFTLSNHSNDLSLREMSSRSLVLILDQVSNSDVKRRDALRDVIITSTILPALRRGLSSKDENQRHEWLRLLVKVAKTAPSESLFSSLTILCNDRDPDGDFFHNVQHIQMHRRTRAFKKLAQLILGNDDEASTISHTLVYTYLLPLATFTLKYLDLGKFLHLRDGCLEVISACAAVMPWAPYIKFLRHNIAMMMREPHGVKVVCAILDSFHFDVASIPEEKAMHLESSHLLIKTKMKNLTDAEALEENQDLNVDCDDETSSIYTVVVCDILPRLCESLSTKFDSDSSHKLADSTSFSDIDNCSSRAPLAIAIVMLLKKLPVRILNKHLPTVILKIIVFLRHRYNEVRASASKVMVEIVEVLEPSYLPIVLRELKDGLMRGYQKHVLLHTVNCIFSKIEPTLKIGSLEPSRKILLHILRDDLFGKGEEERGIDKIKSKIPEARGRSKSYNVFKIYAKFSRRDSIIDAIAPLKAVLDSTHDHNKRKIVESVLNEINHGLQENIALGAEDIMIFLHGLLTENMPGIFKKASSKQERKKELKPESCYLLSTEPERFGVKDTKKSQKTNLHLLIEFALQFLNSTLKRRVIDANNETHIQMLDPFVVVLKQCLVSPHSKIVAEATRCLTKLLHVELPSFSENAIEIINSLFKLIRENSRGAAHNDTVAATYKALSVICKNDIGTKLTDTQLQILLGYAEEMLYDRERQSHAFNVLQAIVGKGLVCDEVTDVFDKIRSICIQAHDSAAMAHARQVYLFYLTHYPMTKVILTRHLEFLLAQLSFEFESGRLSSLEMLASMIDALPQAIIGMNSGVIFVPLSAMLLNEESVKCKKLCGRVIKLLLNKLRNGDKEKLFELVLQWYDDDGRPLHQQLAAILVTVFAEAEESEFSRFLSKLMPILLRVVESFGTQPDVKQEEEVQGNEKRKDHFVFHHLSAIHSVIKSCDLMRDTSREADLSRILSSIESLLLHPHTWVRIASSQIYGTIFSSWDLKSEPPLSRAPLYFFKTAEKLRVLSNDFVQQIQSEDQDDKVSEQCVKNLLFIVRALHAWEMSTESKRNLQDTASAEPVSETTKRKSRTRFILVKLLKTSKQEAANNIKETSRRTAVLKLFAAVSISIDNIEIYLSVIMDLIYRETERKVSEHDGKATALKTLAHEVMDVVKGKIGTALFTQFYNETRKKVLASRRDRKRQRDVVAVTDPQRAALFKRRKQMKKKEQRKRKIGHLRPDYAYKRSKQS